MPGTKYRVPVLDSHCSLSLLILLDRNNLFLLYERINRLTRMIQDHRRGQSPLPHERVCSQYVLIVWRKSRGRDRVKMMNVSSRLILLPVTCAAETTFITGKIGCKVIWCHKVTDGLKKFLRSSEKLGEIFGGRQQT